jgi:hypothetical protein
MSIHPEDENKAEFAPDFAIVGAPKCGTTSIFKALKLHPRVWMSPIKEPNYYAPDFAGCRVIKEARAYAGLFLGAKGRLRGESSTLYLRSETAIPSMLERRPTMRFIALVRNPLDFYQSYHNEAVRTRHEDETDPERAWRLQEQRALGHRIPAQCQEPPLLQYRWLCSFGDQIARLIGIVPESQRKVIVYDDLLADPGSCMAGVYEFLEIEEKAIHNFPRTNQFAVPRCLLITDFLQSLQTIGPLRQLRLRLKPPLNSVGIAPLDWLWRANLRKISKPPLAPSLLATMKTELASDVAKLGRVLKRDFSGWLEPAGSK